jgi:GntR family transcriptional regulator/MocR family aminotransferase
VVLPEDLVDTFLRARLAAVRFPPTFDQAVAADFISGGHLMRHIRRMRALYLQRQQVLLDAAARELSGVLRVEPAPAGMHLIGLLPERLSDRAVAAEARKRGVDTQALSSYSLGRTPWNGLLLGYAAHPERELRLAMKRLAAAVEAVSK